MHVHGIKRVKPDPLQAFVRVFNSKVHEGLDEWYKQALTVLKDNEKLYLRFMLLSGVRAMEGVKAFNLIAEIGGKYKEEYYNENTGFLEHFKYPKLFLRNSKNLYVSAVPKELLDQISKSQAVSYNSVDKKLDRAGLKMRVKQLRSYYAMRMRELGLLSEQIHLIQGRVGRSIFLQHYFKQDAKQLCKRIFLLLDSLEPILPNGLVVCLLENEDVSFTTYVFKYFWPHRYTNLAQMCFLEYCHLSAGLSDATSDAERNFVFHNGLVVWIFEKIKLT